ncbi:unnamed protein product [Cylicocyclus nassatus]|uniref:Uncharacterized protein n=1 Tax=Cylicocyclus nassatus TaxID=53992 RepID=A0AA36GQC4_CYLNA|nr:unnamed protein product [Cylicocyclus nassatus]
MDSDIMVVIGYIFGLSFFFPQSFGYSWRTGTKTEENNLNELSEARMRWSSLIRIAIGRALRSVS